MPKELQDLIDGIIQTTGPYLPRLGGALAILLLGWLAAFLLAKLVRLAVRVTNLDDALGQWLQRGRPTPPPVERWIGSATFYVILMLTVIGAIQVLGVTIIADPLLVFLVEIFGYLPQLIGAGILLLLAWLLATVLRFTVRQLLSAFGFDEKVSSQTRDGDPDQGSLPLAQILSDVSYWLVFLFFLPAILGALGIEGLLSPVQDTVAEVLTFLPNIIGAGLILLIGWFVARVVRRLVTNLLVASGADTLSARIGLGGVLAEQRLSGLVGLIVYALILVPVILGALNALALDALTGPTSAMLNTILQAIPAVLAAAIVLTLAYVVGRIVAELIANLLGGVGFNNLPARLGLGGLSAIGTRTPAQVVGFLVVSAFMVVALLGASSLLGFGIFSELVSGFLVLAGHVLLGLVIFGVGLFLGSLSARLIQASNVTLAGLWAMAARVAILFLSGAIALRAMGFANEIVILAFGLPVAAISVASAIAFGIGGRDIAARELDNMVGAIRGGDDQT